MEIFVALGVIAVIALFMTFKIVPQQEAWILETLGKYDRTMTAGLQIVIPIMQRVAYKQSYKEQVLDIPAQAAITQDNVALQIDGVLYTLVTDPYKASYNVGNVYLAISQLAQTTMRAEIGQMPLDRTFEKREVMNANIVRAINEASSAWGIQCMRYEIKDIQPPHSVLQAMELQVAAERRKRAEILDSEGKSQSLINIAEADRQQVVLESEGAMTDQINRAKGEAEAIRSVAEATAEGIEKVAAAIQNQGGKDAVALRVAEQYVSAFSKLAKTNNTLIIPADAGDVGSMMAKAMGVFEGLKKPA
jgi:regulator of protease activity HflC (stomatin/prohibitin superfamily)